MSTSEKVYVLEEILCAKLTTKRIFVVNQSYTCGRFGSTVPFDFEVSVVPSPLVLPSGLSVECFVSALLSPSCLDDSEPLPAGGFDAVAYQLLVFC